MMIDISKNELVCLKMTVSSKQFSFFETLIVLIKHFICHSDNNSKFY